MDPHLRQLQREIGNAISTLEPGQLSWHEPGKWCVAQILEHLYLTYTGTIKGCGRLLEAGRPLASRATFSQRLQSVIVVTLGYLPSGRKSPEVARPRGLPPEKVAGEFQDKIMEMDVALTQCAEKFGTRARVMDHPVLGPFSISQWRKFHLVHGLHHAKQIRNLRRQFETTARTAAAEK
jgi:hypothetical protein